MFSFAILIGIYSYLILAIGLMGILHKQNIVVLTIFYILIISYCQKKSLIRLTKVFFERGGTVWHHRVEKLIDISSRLRSNNIFIFILFAVLFLQAFINFIGAFGPELGFDALWYHLTLPKLYLENHSIFFIPGGLLYYSLMPKLTEMLYTVALSFNSEILAKLIHFSFGLLSSIALYKLSRTFFSPKLSLIPVVVFYSNLVVGWQSTTAYVDLVRTFFEIMALWGFVNFWKKGEKKWLIESAVMLGLAVSTKLLALGSLFIFSALIVLYFMLRHSGKSERSVEASRISNRGWRFWTSQNDRSNFFYYLLIYWFIALLIPLPWFVFSYINTGNPVYPFFTDIYKVGFNVELLNPFRFVWEVWTMLMKSSDPISPVFIIFLPLAIILFKKFKPEIKLITVYSLLAIAVWYVTPRTGGGRFILPYLPAFSIVVAGMLEKIGTYSSRERSESRSFIVLDSPRLTRLARTINFKSWCIVLVIFVSLISVIYRGIANSKYVPVLLGKQTKGEFLMKHLNFSFGDFYDTDGYFKRQIKQSDKVLLYGFHNLYYVDFPFIDSSWVKKGDSFDYIDVQNTDIPKRFRDWDLIYQNPKTNVKIYSKGEIKWAY